MTDVEGLLDLVDDCHDDAVGVQGLIWRIVEKVERL
jgi:hypothetical protein